MSTRPDRLTLSFTSSHEHFGDETTQVNAPAQITLKHSEQTYTRRVNVNDKWTPLDLGWMSKCSGFIVIQNVSNVRPPTVNPSSKQIEMDESKIIEVGARDHSGDVDHSSVNLVLPGFPYMFLPSSPDRVMVRGMVADGCAYRVTVYPR